MIKNRLKIVFFVVALATLPSKSLAEVSYRDQLFDLYISPTIFSSSVGVLKPFTAEDLFNPLSMMVDNGVSFEIGFRPLGKVPVLRNIRFSVERAYYKAMYPKIFNADVAAGEVTTTVDDGMGSFKALLGANVYIDMKGLFSDTKYPYIGFGMGQGRQRYRDVDLTELDDGLGERYTGSGDSSYLNLMVGFVYFIPYLKASVHFEYRFVKAASSATLVGKEIFDEEGNLIGNAGTTNARFVAHNIGIGVTFYIY